MPRLALLLLLLLLPACGAARHPTVGVPGDLALGVTVLGSREAVGLPRAQRPAQYILETDGSLRVAVGAGVEPSTYPARVRRLTPRQVAHLWALVTAGQFNSPDHPGHLDDISAFRPNPRDGWALIDITANAKRQIVALRPADDPAGARVVDELAGLAWIRP